MGTEDVEETLKLALNQAGLETARVRHRPRLFSDHGSPISPDTRPCFSSASR
jgi:hypothetical protein